MLSLPPVAAGKKKAGTKENKQVEKVRQKDRKKRGKKNEVHSPADAAAAFQYENVWGERRDKYGKTQTSGPLAKRTRRQEDQTLLVYAALIY